MIYLAVCSLIWAFSYGLIKYNLSSLSPDFVAWTRMIIPLLLFLPFLKIRACSFQRSLQFLFIGAIQYGLMYLLVIRSYAYLPSYQILLFTACTPIYVTLIEDFLSKSFKPFFLFTAVLAFVGVALLTQLNFETGADLFKGFLLVQLADACFALGQVVYRRIKIREEGLADKNIYAYLFLGGTLITSISTSLFHGWESLSTLSLKQGGIILYLGVIASGLCFFWWNKFAVLIHSGTLAVFNNAKIPLGVFVSLTVFGEKASLFPVLLSLGVIGFALFLAERKSKNKVRIGLR